MTGEKAGLETTGLGDGARIRGVAEDGVGAGLPIVEGAGLTKPFAEGGGFLPEKEAGPLGNHLAGVELK